jgi:hypothetical protein
MNDAPARSATAIVFSWKFTVEITNFCGICGRAAFDLRRLPHYSCKAQKVVSSLQIKRFFVAVVVPYMTQRFAGFFV